MIDYFEMDSTSFGWLVVRSAGVMVAPGGGRGGGGGGGGETARILRMFGFDDGRDNDSSTSINTSK